MEQVLALIRQRGITVLDDDVARLSPLGHDHITMLGHFPEIFAQGHLSPATIVVG